jgi:hypothetical protein
MKTLHPAYRVTDLDPAAERGRCPLSLAVSRPVTGGDLPPGS